MPYKCAVFGCKSGYDSQITSKDVSFHKFPEQNDILVKWLRNLSREPAFQPTKQTRVCSLHFVASDFIRESQDTNLRRKMRRTGDGESLNAALLTKRRLKPEAVPTQFSSTAMPSYFTKPPPAERSDRATAQRRHEIDNAVQEQRIEEFFREDAIGTFEILVQKFEAETKPSGFLTLQTDDSLNIMLVSVGPPPSVKSSIVVSKELNVAVYNGNLKTLPSHYHHIIPTSTQLSSISQLINLMAFVKSVTESSPPAAADHRQAVLDNLGELLDECDDDSATQLTFLREQMMLTGVAKNGRRYSPELLVFSYILHAASPAAYLRVLESKSLILPSVKTLKKVTKKMDSQTGLDDVEYLRLRLARLQAYETNVILLIDEIYLSKRVEMSGGELHGLTEEGNVAQTALCFMIKSAVTKYRDLVGIFPVLNLTAETIHKCYLRVMPMLHKIGFSVVAISVDNAASNRRFYSHFLCSGHLEISIINPYNGQKLFLLFDPTHNVKNMYNNFISRKEFMCPSFAPIMPVASRALFSDVQKVYDIEATKPVKMAHKLTNTVMHPTNIEKVNVQLAVALFHESTISALNYYGFRETARVLEVCLKLWNVLNVRTTTIGKHKRDISRDPVRSSMDWKLEYLKDFALFLDAWEISGKPGLTVYTFLAVRHTCRAMAALVAYLLDCCDFSYVLMGKFQSDNLEARFGWTRQLCGANYFISMRQLMESDRKIRAISLLKYSGITVSDIDEALRKRSPDTEDLRQLADQIYSQMIFECSPDKSDMAIVYYVSGFCARSLVRTKKCESCKDSLVCDTPVAIFDFEQAQQAKDASDFLAAIDRGGLYWPQEHLFLLGLLCWRVFSEIKSTRLLRDQFLSATNQRELFHQVMDLALADNHEILFCKTHCTNGHDVAEEIVSRFFNCMAKMLVREINQQEAAAAVHRKLKKLTGFSAH